MTVAGRKGFAADKWMAKNSEVRPWRRPHGNERLSSSWI